jgi:hypothetical protein
VSNSAKIIKAWVAFLKSGFAQAKFTQSLYHHLYQHCSFIAHFDRHGFYAVYFTTDAEATLKFIDQFDPNGHGLAAELGGHHWRTGDCADINEAMREAARPFISKLREATKAAEKTRDLVTARTLLAKHGEKS